MTILKFLVLFILPLTINADEQTQKPMTNIYENIIQRYENLTLTKTSVNCLELGYSSTATVSYKLMFYNLQLDGYTGNKLARTYEYLTYDETYNFIFENLTPNPITVTYYIDNCSNSMNETVIFSSILIVFCMLCCVAVIIRDKIEPICQRQHMRTRYYYRV